jgi:hypothetical protein
MRIVATTSEIRRFRIGHPAFTLAYIRVTGAGHTEAG